MTHYNLVYEYPQLELRHDDGTLVLRFSTFAPLSSLASHLRSGDTLTYSADV